MISQQKSIPALPHQAASFDQVTKTFFFDQAADRNELRRRVRKFGRSEAGQFDAVVDAVDFRRLLRMILPEEMPAEFAHRHHRAGGVYEMAE